MTDRIGVGKSSPNTEFFLEADYVQTDAPNNRTLCRCFLRCRNSGDGTARFLNGGAQKGYHNGWEFGRHEGTPFLPYWTAGAQRWRDQFDFWVWHDDAGNYPTVEMSMHLLYGNINEWHGAPLPAPPRIAKPPSAPGAPSFSGLGPKTVTVGWTTPTDNRGSAINGYQVLISTNSNPETSPVVNWSGGVRNDLTVYTLDPATLYYAKVRARNSSNGVWGDWSAVRSFRTLSGAYVGANASLRGAEVLVGKGGSFVTVTEVRIGKDGSFVIAG